MFSLDLTVSCSALAPWVLSGFLIGSPTILNWLPLVVYTKVLLKQGEVGQVVGEFSFCDPLRLQLSQLEYILGRLLAVMH